MIHLRGRAAGAGLSAFSALARGAPLPPPPLSVSIWGYRSKFSHETTEQEKNHVDENR